MKNRRNISSGAKWEDIVGYSRAVRVGNTIEVAGTTAVDEFGKIVGLNNPYEQTRYILTKIETVLRAAGATLNDIVTLRIYIVQSWMDKTAPVSAGLKEFFPENPPATTWIGAYGLARPEFLIEIEGTAVI